MIDYIVRRLIFGIFVLLIMTTFIFIIMRAVPGDVVTLQLANSGATPEQMAALKAEMGLDKSVFGQLIDWGKNALQGDLGSSLWSGKEVSQIILDRLPVTIQLALMAIVLAIIIGIPIGVISAVKQNTFIDHFLKVISIGGLSIPSFWLGLILLTVLSLSFNWIPPLGYQSFAENPIVNLQQMFLPAICLAITLSASIVRMTRSAVLEVLHSEFIRTVRAKGAKEAVVIFKHALRNSLISVITLIGLQIGYLLGGTVVLESIFALPGLGSLIFETVLVRDYPVVQSTVLVFGAMFLLVNLMVDVMYGWVDPRIRTK
ncbi:ABC transporter permease [Solibacillus sp. FSL W7-1472]|uniref:Glutathione transport system permease protein gsiC n=1 Tax=Solibacillus isronensis B3W22 TaxID=1224748 RepID=K1KQQ8_9BACL|nr:MULTISPECIES: ABC transporter permease [Solibacillus]AMO85836.1 glutathione ABC transporter permease [Solibacillus silvestris]EKB46495.1 Glutathione transport system permease protein gsiC [Solibacillus isronensis B3W22]MCM3721104.1 ABC transporter permease [Solibacillus isronensis]OBW60226.1 glutathione ABC transporter permease GsiC [Solibacillus silvestris]